jgi:hypothetical protein
MRDASDPHAHWFYDVVELLTRPLVPVVVATLYVAAALKSRSRTVKHSASERRIER